MSSPVVDPGVPPREPALPHFELPPSLVEFAAEALRRMIISGELMPGDRVVENQLTKQLGISRPPLREALRVLGREGLLLQQPRRGTIVTPLTLHDVYEIFTLRWEYERLAMQFALPVMDETRLARVRQALHRMGHAADTGDEATYGEQSFEFHLSVVALSGHMRLEAAYRSLQLQMQLCMAMNRRARRDEDLPQDVERHQRLLDLIEAGDVDKVLHEFSHHGDRTFLEGIEDRLDGHTEVSLSWLAETRASRTA